MELEEKSRRAKWVGRGRYAVKGPHFHQHMHLAAIPKAVWRCLGYLAQTLPVRQRPEWMPSHKTRGASQVSRDRGTRLGKARHITFCLAEVELER